MDIPNCKLCQNPFDLKTSLPIILPKCGHTYCKQCLYDILSQSNTNSITCPEDGRVGLVEMPRYIKYKRAADE